MSHKILRYPKTPNKLIPLNNEKDLQEALNFNQSAITATKIAKEMNPPMSLRAFQARRKRNRLARKNRG